MYQIEKYEEILTPFTVLSKKYNPKINVDIVIIFHIFSNKCFSLLLLSFSQIQEF